MTLSYTALYISGLPIQGPCSYSVGCETFFFFNNFLFPFSIKNTTNSITQELFIIYKKK